MPLVYCNSAYEVAVRIAGLMRTVCLIVPCANHTKTFQKRQQMRNNTHNNCNSQAMIDQTL
eukprot:6436-Heterococcus_DN1.PRE.12